MLNASQSTKTSTKKTDCGTVYRQILTDEKLKTGKKCQKNRAGWKKSINPLNVELNPICYLLALLVAHHFLHVSRIRVKSLTLRQLIYIYIYIYIYI